MSAKEKRIIGRTERVDLPHLDLEEIDAKIDTGAYSSSLHCHRIEVKGNVVRFNLLDPEHPHYNDRPFELPVYDRRVVKSSNGIAEERIFIQTKLNLFEDSYDIELSLADRSEMKYPLLIGRKFLDSRYLVDVSKENLSLNNRKKVS